jgi:tyrosine-protein kinase Etk/Wzc
VGPDSVLDTQGARFDLKVLSASRFELHIDENTYLGSHSFNTPISTRIGLISFVKNKNFGGGTVGNEFIVQLAPIKEVANSVGGQITLARVDKVSDLISVSMNGPVIEKNNEIITTLIHEHETQSIYDKNEMTRKTSAFINDRMAYITEELSDVEKDVEAFKTKHNIVDVATQGGEFVAKQSAAEEQIIQTSVQLSLNEYLQEYLQKHQEYTELLPSNLGFEDGSIVAMTTQYNKLLLDRQRLLKNSSLKNPAVQKIDDQLIGLRHSMEEGLRSNKSRLKITLNSLNVVDKRYKDKIASVPGYEREFRDIERQQKIKETLYLSLIHI